MHCKHQKLFLLLDLSHHKTGESYSGLRLRSNFPCVYVLRGYAYCVRVGHCVVV